MLLPRDFIGYLALWSAGHGGYDPRGNALALGWLRLTYRTAVPLARRRVAPHAITALGVLVCALVPLVASFGAGWPLLAVPIIVASGLADSVDGAVALLSGRSSRFGAVLDGVADRVGEALYLVALWLLGAPAWLCVVAGGITWLQEYARARAGLDDIGVVTVWERPTRIVVTAFALGFAGLAGLIAPGYVAGVVTVGTAAWVVLGAIGLAQFLLVARRRLA